MSQIRTQAIFNFVHIYIICAFSIILFAGIIGNLCNIIIFTSLRKFRKCPGAFYICAESIVSIGVLFFGTALRIAEEIFSFSADRISLIWCKMRVPITQWCVLVVVSLVNFAVFDQYFSTSLNPDVRQRSTIKLGIYLTSIATLFWFVYIIPFAIFYDIKLMFGCHLTHAGMIKYYVFFHLLILHGLLPMTVASTFSICAYRNVRRIHRQQMSKTRRRIDLQLTAMILARVVLFVISLVPFIIQAFFAFRVHNNNKRPLQTANDILITVINMSISYLNFSVKCLANYCYLINFY